MITLSELQTKYQYKLLTSEEIIKVRENTVNWEGLDGEIIRRKVLSSYPAYLQLVNYGYNMTAYHYDMASRLQRDFEKGPNIGMPYGLILLSAPPQTGKSLTITESFQSWVLMKSPRTNILTLGYESTFAARFGRKNRDKFSMYAPKVTRNRVKIHDKIQSTETWETMIFDKALNIYTSANGGMNTAGMGGAVTGKTGNVVIVDDPIKNMQDANSETQIENNIDYYEAVIETRLLGNPGSLCVVMCTRWALNDLTGWLRRHRKKFIVGDYNYAALCTELNKDRDPLKREVGEGICPEMGQGSEWALVVKESYTASQGAHVFNAMFQGDPTDELGNLFKMENWEEYEIDKVWKPDTFDKIYLSIDATFKDKTTNDYVAMELWGIKAGNAYLRYLVRKHMDLPDTLDKIVELYTKFTEIDVIYIEDKANGPGIISVLRKWRRKLGIEDKDFPSIIPLEPIGGKYSRAQAASPYQREGRCYIPCEKDANMLSSSEDFEWDEKGVAYTYCFRHELGTFPYGANDDLVDAFDQAIIKNIPLLTGEEKPVARPVRFVRYSKWWPEMEKDYRDLKTDEEKKAFVKKYGANEKWKPKSEGGIYGVI